MGASGIFHPPICVHLDSLEATGMQIGHLGANYPLVMTKHVCYGKLQTEVVSCPIKNDVFFF